MTTRALTLRDLFDGLWRFGAKPAVVADGVETSYAELVAAARTVAANLASRGVAPGTPVALAMSNRVEFLIADQALIMLGAAKVPVNDMLSVHEINFILRDSGAVVVITDRQMLGKVLGARCDGVEHVFAVDAAPQDAAPEHGEQFRPWSDLMAEPAHQGPFARAEPDDHAFVLYTGGTTGRQKGVVHTQAGLAINLLAHIVEMGLLDDERMLLSTPLPHAAGMLAQASLLKGATIYIERKFDADSVLDVMARHQITYTFMVPTMIYRILDKLAARDAQLPALRTILYGAAPIAETRLDQGLALLGPVFMQLYGQTEAPDFLTRLTKEDHLDKRRLASCGRPVALMEVKVAGPGDDPLPPREIGEVIARGPYVMHGYLNLKEKTEETLRGGWLHTGDLGWMDEAGYLYLVDRKNDMIISGGMNVYSTEVENVVQACPGVAQVAVVGVVHPDWGEAVVAFVVPAADGSFSEAVAAELCRERLASYKRPKKVIARAELPLTPYGKVDKKQLRTQELAW